MRIKRDYPPSHQKADPSEAPISGSAIINTVEFPSARYFQIHFEHLNELLGDIRHRLGALQQQIAALQHDSRYDSADK